MRNLKILIVDDDEDFAESLEEFLQSKGHKIVLACSGEEAITKYGANGFDIIFMDIKMPGKNGVEALTEIKSINLDAKVVMMTGYSVGQLLDKALQNGAMGVLHKPLVLDVINSMLEKVDTEGVILIADDDEDFVTALQEVLQNRGYTVKVARDGQQAVDHILMEKIDLMLLDLRLPILNGTEVCQMLLERGRLPRTIIVTAYAGEEEVQIAELKTMSIEECLLKPFTLEKLLGTIQLAMV